MINNEPVVCYVDIEVAPNIGYTWSKYETNVIEYVQDWYILCASWKFLGGKLETTSLPDFPGYRAGKSNDRKVMEMLWKVLDEADVVVAHNGAAFDLRKINARFLYHGMTPPSSYKVVDTLKIARKYFQFDSNKLDDLSQYLKLGKKLAHGGFELWKGCMAGEKKAWATMKEYNRQDVVLLEKLYLRLRPWMEQHPNFLKTPSDPIECPACGGKNLQRRGYQKMTGGKEKPRAQCKDCGKWCVGKIIKNKQLINK